MQIYWFLCIFLTLTLPLTASEKTGNNNQLCVPENMQALIRAQSWPSETFPAKEQVQPAATGRKRVTRARFGATSAPTILNTNMPTGSESGYGTDGSTGGDSDDDNLNSLYFSAHLASTHTIPKHIPAAIKDFQDSSDNPAPSKMYPPEVVAAQAACLRRLNVLKNELHAPTVRSEDFIEAENDLTGLALIQAELEDACNARKEAREQRTKIKPLKYVTFPKGPVSTEFSKRKISFGDHYVQAEFQTDIEQMWARALNQRLNEAPLESKNRLTTFYAEHPEPILSLDLLGLAAAIVTNDATLDLEDHQELIDRLNALKPKKV